MPQELNLQWAETLPLTQLLVNLAIGVVLSLVIRWHFRRFGSTLSNREEFGQVFPLILLTTVLIITVVKSSLALSLGLVGALSIVRFRTPIKEPEELAYLFITIAIGLGLGANQTLPTIVAATVILLVIALLKLPGRKAENKNVHLTIDLGDGQNAPPERCLERINDILLKHVEGCDLRRFDSRQAALEATYLVSIARVADLSDLVGELQQAFPGAGVTFLDQNHLPSV